MDEGDRVVPPAGRSRPGGRSERVVAAVRQAVRGEMARVGFAALQIDAIAHLAGVARTTIYRRWPTKLELVSDALSNLRQGDGAMVGDSGDVARDLAAFAVQLSRSKTAEKRSIWRMILAEGDHPEVAALVEQLRGEVTRELNVRLEIAIARGELRADLDVGLFIESLLGSLSSRVFIRRSQVDAAFAARLVALFLDGARPRD
ncbi:MAG TPA: TetR/AcrR family transcriptional regulator [Byssovorax sp.]